MPIGRNVVIGMIVHNDEATVFRRYACLTADSFFCSTNGFENKPTRSAERFLSIKRAVFERSTIYSNLFLVSLFFEKTFLNVEINPLLFKRENRISDSAIMMRTKMFLLFVSALIIKVPEILRNPKNGLNLDTMIDPINNPPIIGRTTSCCHKRKMILRINGSSAIRPKLFNELPYSVITLFNLMN